MQLPEWDLIQIDEVLPEKMIRELTVDFRAGILTMESLRRYCATPEYAKHMEERGLLPSLAPFMLAHLLHVEE